VHRSKSLTEVHVETAAHSQNPSIECIPEQRRLRIAPRQIERHRESFSAIRLIQPNAACRVQLLCGLNRARDRTSIRATIDISCYVNLPRSHPWYSLTRDPLDHPCRLPAKLHDTHPVRDYSWRHSRTDDCDLHIGNSEPKSESGSRPAAPEWHDHPPRLWQYTGTHLLNQFKSRVHLSQHTERDAPTQRDIVNLMLQPE
jgi:hypothetical protein